MPTYVHLIDLKRWFIECHIFMPKKAFDYGKTEIYKIIHVDPDIDLCYVGHTTNFVQRQKSHKKNCNFNRYDFMSMYDPLSFFGEFLRF